MTAPLPLACTPTSRSAACYERVLPFASSCCECSLGGLQQMLAFVQRTVPNRSDMGVVVKILMGGDGKEKEKGKETKKGEQERKTGPKTDHGHAA